MPQIAEYLSQRFLMPLADDSFRVELTSDDQHFRSRSPGNAQLVIPGISANNRSTRPTSSRPSYVLKKGITSSRDRIAADESDNRGISLTAMVNRTFRATLDKAATPLRSTV